jgi:hypothetical protein
MAVRVVLVVSLCLAAVAVVLSSASQEVCTYASTRVREAEASEYR